MKDIIKTVLKEQWDVAHKQAVLQKFIDRILTTQFDLKYVTLDYREQQLGETTYSYVPTGVKVFSFESQHNRLKMMVYFPHKESMDGNKVKMDIPSQLNVEQQLKRMAMRYNIILLTWVQSDDKFKYDEANTNEYVKLSDETEVGGLNWIYKP